MDCKLALGLVVCAGVCVSAVWFVVAGFFVGGVVLFLPVLFVILGCGVLAAKVVCVSRLEKCAEDLEKLRKKRNFACDSDWLFESDLGLDVDEIELIEQWIDVNLR